MQQQQSTEYSSFGAAKKLLTIMLKDKAIWCVNQVTVKRAHQNWEGNPNIFHSFFWPSFTLFTATTLCCCEQSVCKAECK